MNWSHDKLMPTEVGEVSDMESENSDDETTYIDIDDDADIMEIIVMMAIPMTIAILKRMKVIDELHIFMLYLSKTLNSHFNALLALQSTLFI